MRSFFWTIFILLFCELILSAQEPAGNADCLECHGDPALTATLDGKRVSLYINKARYMHSIHGNFSCSTCHPGDPHSQTIPPELRGTPRADLIRKLKRRNGVALTACFDCHTREFEQYRISIHGRASFSGVKEAPVCSNCHGNHYITRISDPESMVRPQHVPATCGTCHSNQRLMAQFNINTHTVSTYSQSFHGRRLALGSRRVAECSSCHGYHGIFAPTDPRSSVYPANRPKTCGKPGCHPGASPRFAAGFAHRIPSPRVDPATYWAGQIYNLIILGTAGLMMLWVLLDLFRRFRRWGWHWRAPHPADLPVPLEVPVKRWDVHQRLQHFMLLFSFTALVLTGLPMLFPLSPVSQALVGMVGGPETAGRIHRVMASLLLLGAAYHLVYLTIRLSRRHIGTSMVPNLKDLRDSYQMVRYYVGLSPDPPRYDRYTFDEKVEYWSMIWGTIVMAITGLILWFPLGPARVLGYWSVDLSRIVHGYEAVLAAIAIILWHFYHAHLNPDVFPMNFAWITGEITAEEEARHHPLEFDRMLKEGKLKPEPKQNPPQE